MAKLSVDQALLRAKGLARKGQVDEARRVCEAVIEAYPNNKRARAALAGLASSERPVGDRNPPQESLEQLGALLSQGKSGVAAAEAQRLSDHYPESLVVWNLLGAASADSGQIAQAETAFRRAIALNPNLAEAHRNLGKILIEKGELSEAIDACKRALHLRPDYYEASNILGNALKASGRLEDAATAYLRVLKIQPNYVEVLYNLGNTLLEMGKGDKAAQVFQKALALQPGFVGAQRGLVQSLLSQGRSGDAVSICREAVASYPDSAAAHLMLATALRQDGLFSEALTTVRSALDLAPGDANARNDLGLTLQAQNRLDDAIAAFGEALKIRPDFVQARKNLGVALLSKGAKDQAIAEYEKVLATAPGDAEAHRHLSTFKTYAAGDPQLAEMTNLLTREDLTDADRCQLCFALAKATDDLGDFQKSFGYLKDGNSLRKQLLGYEIAADRALFSDLGETAEKLQAAALADFAEPSAVTPVFILGMPRSGTTLVEQIVSAHSAVTGAGELGLAERHGAALATGEIPATTDSLTGFREAYLDGIGRLSEGRRIVTDKMPLNFRFIAVICAALPEAKIIHVQRDPAATCWSNYRQYFENRNLGYCYDLADTVAYHRLYRDLMGVWASNYGSRIHDLDYDALTIDQETQTRQLMSYLGLDWEDACLSPQTNVRPVATASQQQVREPVYKGSSQHWRRFEPFLNGALDALPT